MTVSVGGSENPEHDAADYQKFDEAKEETKHNIAASTKRESIQWSRIRQQMVAFGAISRVYFAESSQGRFMFLGLVLLMILNSAVRVFFSYLARDFWTALGDQDEEEFYKILKLFLVALLVLAPINVLYRFQQQRLAIKWREWMTKRMLNLYYTNRVYYSLERSNVIDNPDQRIAEDVRSFTQYSLSLFLTMAVSLIDLTCFSIILYSIKPALFISIIGFAAVGTFATVLIGKQLIQLNYNRLQKEADFRYSLVRIREHAESIAFFRGEAKEVSLVRSLFAQVLTNAYALIGTQRNLDFFTTLYNYLTWILPIVVIAPEYFAGKAELGVIQQSAAAFGHVLEDLSIVINEFESLSEFSASIGRLHQFVRAVQQADNERDESSPLLSVAADGVLKTGPKKPTRSKADQHHDEEAGANDVESASINLKEFPALNADSLAKGSALVIRNLQLSTPDGHRSLIQSLHLTLSWGENLLIVGESGVGKSSLLRAIAGLWTFGSGTIERANIADVYFLPQKPCKFEPVITPC